MNYNFNQLPTWICPRCSTVYSSYVIQCKCNGSLFVSDSTSIEPERKADLLAVQTNIEEYVKEEREACAKVAEDCNKELKILLSNNKISDDLTQKCLISLASKVIAKAIRERK